MILAERFARDIVKHVLGKDSDMGMALVREVERFLEYSLPEPVVESIEVHLNELEAQIIKEDERAGKYD